MENNVDTSEDLSFDASNMDMEDALFGANPWELADLLGSSLPDTPVDFLSIDPTQEEDQPGVSFEDFEGVEQFIFVRMRDQIRLACNVNTPWKRRKRAISWLFISGDQQDEDMSFNESCRALGARKMVLQTRLQYQLFRAGLPLPEPLPFLADPLPETLCMEVLLHGGELGLDIAKTLWAWPGMRVDLLKAEFCENGDDALYNRTIKHLEDAGLIGLREVYWFFISRNPDLYAIEGRRRFQWSRSFLGNH